MGGILSYLLGWSAPTPNYDKTPDPNTGLSEYDRYLITSTWALVSDKKCIKDNGVEFFVQLFRAFPYMQDFFPLFKNKDVESLRNKAQMKAHALSVMYTIGSFVENMDDPEVLVGLVKKLAATHIPRGIKEQEFKDLETMFTGYLRALMGSACTSDIEQAWGKLLAAQTSLVKQTEEEMMFEDK